VSAGNTRRARFGRYELLDELGRGGMGTVWRARDPQGGRLVALKLIAVPHAADPDVLERFRIEARATARLKHPHVVAVIDGGFEGPYPYLALELVEGESLAARLGRQGPLPERQAARLVAKVARGVAAAHAVGVLHRDLKPENVLVDREGEPRLTDFGLARELWRGERGLTVTGEVLGTPATMAPEQAMGDPRAIGPAADVYGLGALLYAALTGRPPFEGANPMSVLFAVTTEPPAPPSTHRPGLDPGLEALCLRCLAKDPAERPGSARALAEALEAWAPAAPPPRRPPGPHRQLLAGLTAAGLAVAAGLVALAVAGDEPAADVAAPSAPAPRSPSPREPAESPAPPADVSPEAPGADPPAPTASPVPASAEPPAPAASPSPPQPAAPSSPAGADSPEVAQARVHADAGRAREVVAVLQGAPGADAHELRGWALERLGDLEAAIAEYDRAIALDPGRASAWERRGVARERAGRPGAVADLRRAVELGPGPEPARELAITLFDRGDADGALAAVAELVRRAPADPSAWRLAAGIRARTGRYGLAEEAFTRLLELEPADAPALANRGLVRFHQGRFADAVADYSRALALRERADTLARRADALRELGQLEEARADCDQALALDPDLAAAWRNRALVRLDAGDPEGALDDADRAVALEPESGTGYVVRAVVGLALGRTDGALADAARAAELAPNRADAWIALGKARDAANDPAGAVAALTRAADLDPDGPYAVEALLTRVDVLRRAGELEAAARDCARLERVVRAGGSAAERVVAARAAVETPSRTAPHRRRRPPERDASADGAEDDAIALLYREADRQWQTGDRQGAIASLGAILARDPTLAWAWHDRAVFRGRQGDAQGALADLDEALRRAPGASVFWNTRARVRSHLGRHDQAVADARCAVSLAPGESSGWQTLMFVLDRAGRSPEALTASERALALEPLPEYRFSHANLLYTLGRREEAIEGWSRALEDDPTLFDAWYARGRARIDEGDLPAAERDLSRALELDPRHAWALALRARLRAARGATEGARADGRRAAPLAEPGSELAVHLTRTQWILDADAGR